MKSFSITILLCTSLCFPLFAGSVDTSSSAKSSDEELILDEGPSTVVPIPTDMRKLEKKTSIPSVPVADSSARAKSAVAPAPAVVPAPAPITAPAVAPVQNARQAPNDKTISPPTQTTFKKVDTAARKIVDEELILDGGEEDLLSGQAKKAPSRNTVADSTAAKQDTAAAGAGSSPDTAKMAAPQGQKPMAPDVATPLVVPAIPTVAAKVENARSINFAANLKGYRSPKLAMLMSLVLPGSGQVYTKANWWAAGFLVVEAAIVVTGFSYSSKSKAQKVQAHRFADTAYSWEKFSTYAVDLRSNLSNVGPRGDTIYASIFFDSSDVVFLNEAKKDPGKRSDYFYDDVASETSPFIRGWRDVTPPFSGNGFGDFGGDTTYHLYSSSLDTSYLVYRNSDKANASFGFSDYQVHYKNMLDESRRLANFSRNVFITLLVNHLASAVMAGIEAKNHNDALLGKETFWRHIDVGQQIVNTGSQTVSGYSVGVRF